MTSTHDALAELRRLSPRSPVLNHFPEPAGTEACATATVPTVGVKPQPAGSGSTTCESRSGGFPPRATGAEGRRGRSLFGQGPRQLLHPLVLVALLLQGCAALKAPDDWQGRDTALEVAFQSVNAADAFTTARIQRTPGIVETSPIPRELLGLNPSTRETAVYFATVGLSHYLIARALPAKWRPWFQGGSVAYEAEAVRRNCDNGLC